VSVGGKVGALPVVGQAERLVHEHLSDREAVVHLKHTNVPGGETYTEKRHMSSSIGSSITSLSRWPKCTRGLERSLGSGVGRFELVIVPIDVEIVGSHLHGEHCKHNHNVNTNLRCVFARVGAPSIASRGDLPSLLRPSSLTTTIAEAPSDTCEQSLVRR
jgi:hypothetical protein